MVLFRYLILGGLVFGSVTYIPSTPITVRSKAIISVIVVGVYALLDLLADLTPSIRRFICRQMCDDSTLSADIGYNEGVGDDLVV